MIVKPSHFEDGVYAPAIGSLLALYGSTMYVACFIGPDRAMEVIQKFFLHSVSAPLKEKQIKMKIK